MISADPIDAIRRQDVTGHSIMVKLLPSPVNEFKVVASALTLTPALPLPRPLPAPSPWA